MLLPEPPEKGVALRKVTARLREILLEAMSKPFWIRAQFIPDKGSSSSGHCYGHLIDVDEQGNTVAKLPATIWSAEYEMIQRKLKAAGITEGLRANLEICALSAIRYHEVHGLQVTLFDVDPNAGESHVERNRRLVIERLRAEGLLERNQTLELSVAPLRIGLITAADSAAHADFIQTLIQSRFAFRVVLAPATMQGDQTVPTVLQAIERLLRESIDVLCIVRGGGSPVDLAWLDAEPIARAVALSPIPVWVGIGHEIDYGVLDVVAHQSHKTPTEVAKVLVERLQVLADRLQSAAERLAETSIRQLDLGLLDLERKATGLLQGSRKHSTLHAERFESSVQRLQDVARRITEQAEVQLAQARKRLVGDSERSTQKTADTLQANKTGLLEGSRKHQDLLRERHRRRVERLYGAVDRVVTVRQGQLRTSVTKLSERTRSLVGRAAERLQFRVSRLNREAFDRRIAATSASLDEKRKRRDALDPKRLLDRGYSVTRDANGRVVTSVGQLSSGQNIWTQLKDGTLTSTIEDVVNDRR